VIVEVISVGTEILIGQIVNSNSAFIATCLADAGIDAHFQVVVGDNLDRLSDAIRTALGRSDAVILTGGIGPTQDDLTREALCRVTGRAMGRDQAHAAWIEHRLRSQGREVRENVLRMSDLPEGAEGMANANGVALGVALEHEGKWLFAVPGVPVEMMAMLDGEVLPRLRQASGDAVFGVDDETVESLILDGLNAHGWTLGTVEEATLGQVGARIAGADRSQRVFAGSVIVGIQPGKTTAPTADVVLSIGAAVADGQRATRPVEMIVTTPERVTTRVFEFGGDDERLRSFATVAGLHMIRLAVQRSDRP
jgi:nicotinamide-nucleotide amidase